LDWSDDQWNRINTVVQETAAKTRVAAQFLPTVLHPDVSATAVPNRTLNYAFNAPLPPMQRITVDSTPGTFFTTLAVNVALTSQEAADPDLGAALVQFRRAASLVARLEDALLFNGQPGPGLPPPNVGVLPQVFDVAAGGNQPGLCVPAAANFAPRQDYLVPAPAPNGVGPGAGELLVTAIIDGIGALDAAGQCGPYVCVLSQSRFTELHTPAPSFVLPRDRVVPFLEGPLLRSSVLTPQLGLLLALGSGGMEIVVSSELHVRFLQISTEPRYVFRVSERIALRVSDWTSVLVLHA
jgi:hypothetical protein